jgi:hypothetical protein
VHFESGDILYSLLAFRCLLQAGLEAHPGIL